MPQPTRPTTSQKWTLPRVFTSTLILFAILQTNRSSSIEYNNNENVKPEAILSLPNYEDDHVPPSHVDDAALVRKIDMRVLPMLFAIYFVAFLDRYVNCIYSFHSFVQADPLTPPRVNISNALTMSMPTDLNLYGNRANIALLIFYIPYIIFEIPSNIVMKKLKPHIWLSGCIIAFGIVMLGQAFVQSYGGLIATRFFLGLAECGIFPGSFYLISFWYKRAEAQKRFTMYWSSVIFAGAFGGLLASAIAKMDGMRGLENWRWIFLLEGIASILVGIFAFFFCADFPQQASWLTGDEKAAVIAKTRNFEDDEVSVTKADLIAASKDLKLYLAGFMYFSKLHRPVMPFCQILIEENSHRRPYLRFLILRPYHHQSLRIRNNSNSITQCTTFRRRHWTLHCGSIFL